jgi:hypothetical protein
MDSQAERARVLALAERVLRLEAESVLALCPRLDERFVDAVALLQRCRGRVIVTARPVSPAQIAPTLASTDACLLPHLPRVRRFGMVARETVRPLNSARPTRCWRCRPRLRLGIR